MIRIELLTWNGSIVSFSSGYRSILYIVCTVLLLDAKLIGKVIGDQFARNKIVRFKFGFRVRMYTASIFFLVLSLASGTNNFGNRLAEAQSPVTTVQDVQNTNGAIQTFQIDGAIGSLVTELQNSTMRQDVSDSLPPLYVLAGNWSMGVVNAQINYLQVDFVMALENGAQMQVYSIENLENIVITPPTSAQNTGSLTPDQELSSNNDNLVLSSTNNYSLSLFGYVDVLTGGTIEWQNVPVSINIFNGNTISILLYPAETDNRFRGQPIYGVVTWILDANNEPIKPSIWTNVT
jgi:hypothetical protein